jgi:hypothetical protein
MIIRSGNSQLIKTIGCNSLFRSIRREPDHFSPPSSRKAAPARTGREFAKRFGLRQSSSDDHEILVTLGAGVAAGFQPAVSSGFQPE